MSLNDLFEADPIQFLKTYSFDPGAFGYAPIDRSHSRGEDQIFSPNITQRYFGSKAFRYDSGNVRGVLNFKWNATCRSFNLERGQENTVKLVINPDVTEWGVDMYYLPWLSQAMTSMNIPQYGTCNYFTTASLSGCSVFVSGNPQSPTVYHAGSTEKSKYEATELWKRCMVKLLQDCQNPQFFGIDKYDYTKRGTRPGRLKVDADSIVDAYNIAHRNYDFARGRQHVGQEIKRMEAIQSAGCVVGIRDEQSGRWSFYLQERLRYEIVEASTNPNAPPRRTKYFSPVSLRKFYPDGTRHVQLLTRYRFR